MGYHPYYTNAVAVVVYEDNDNGTPAWVDEIDDEAVTQAFTDAGVPCQLVFILGNGRDSRIHGEDVLIIFDKYTQCTFCDLKGDVSGFPTAEEIAAAKAVSDSFGLPWTAPVRTERTYIY